MEAHSRTSGKPSSTAWVIPIGRAADLIRLPISSPIAASDRAVAIHGAEYVVDGGTHSDRLNSRPVFRAVTNTGVDRLSALNNRVLASLRNVCFPPTTDITEQLSDRSKITPVHQIRRTIESRMKNTNVFHRTS